jgi:AcrR family transcriptional regulator
VTEAGPRTRRTSADIRALLLDAARELFLSQGFEATTTKEIAERAGVAEHLLFRNYGNKAELFEVAVLAPIAEFVSDYATSWRSTTEAAPEQRVEAFVDGLYAIAQRDRTVLLAALARRSDRKPNGDPDMIDHVARTLQGLRGVSNLEQYQDADPPATITVALGMILGVALLDDLLFPRNTNRPGKDRLLAEMRKMLLYGTTRRDPSSALGLADQYPP